MFHPHQLHSLSKLYHEEALHRARVRRIGRRAKAHRKPRSEAQGLWSRLGEQAAALRLS